MIHFIDLGDQILEDYPMFAWFDTVIDTFENYGGSEAWETWEEFEEDYWAKEDVVPETHSLDRYRSLFPKNWFEMHHPKEKVK